MPSLFQQASVSAAHLQKSTSLTLRTLIETMCEQLPALAGTAHAETAVAAMINVTGALNRNFAGASMTGLSIEDGLVRLDQHTTPTPGAK